MPKIILTLIPFVSKDRHPTIPNQRRMPVSIYCALVPLAINFEWGHLVILKNSTKENTSFIASFCPLTSTT